MKNSLVEALVVVGAIASSRLLPHPPNATLAGPLALYAGRRFGRAAPLVVGAGLLFSDIVIGFYDWRLLFAVYASFALYILGGRLMQRASTMRILMVSIASSFAFFIVTNTAVWATSTWYPHTFAGFVACLIAGLPFLRNMALADALGTVLLFRLPELLSAHETRYNERVLLHTSSPHT